MPQARREVVTAAVRRLADAPVRITSWQHLGSEVAPVTRLHLDRDIGAFGSTMILKARRTEGIGHGGPAFLRREAAGLETAASSGVTAHLLHFDDEAGFLLQSDLGGAPTLQDLLLGRDQEAAARGMEQMADAIGRLHSATLGWEAEHRARLDGFRAEVDVGLIYTRTSQTWEGVERACADLDLPDARSALGDVRALASRSTGLAVLTHRDLNPTNVLISADGARLVDLEGASIGHPGIDACFLHYPFPHHSVPWGVLPEAVVAAADAAYRTALAEGGARPILETYDQVIADGAAIVLISRLDRLRLIARTDQSPQDAWRRRGQVLQQIGTVLRLTEAAEGLDDLREWLLRLGTAMASRWPEALDPPAPLFPVFRSLEG